MVAGRTVVVVRSPRRRCTASAQETDGVITVRVPATATAAEESRLVTQLVQRIAARRQRPSDEWLARRASKLASQYLPAQVRPSQVRWSSRQGSRWGSCQPGQGRIRISDRLVGMPDYVLDYVIVHELTHLLHFDHGPAFQECMSRYGSLALAQAYLAGVTFARQLSPAHFDGQDCAISEGEDVWD